MIYDTNIQADQAWFWVNKVSTVEVEMKCFFLPVNENDQISEVSF